MWSDLPSLSEFSTQSGSIKKKYMFFWNSLFRWSSKCWQSDLWFLCLTSLNNWKLTVHVLLKPGLKNFEHTSREKASAPFRISRLCVTASILETELLLRTSVFLQTENAMWKHETGTSRWRLPGSWTCWGLRASDMNVEVRTAVVWLLVGTTAWISW